ncbi:alpha/beta hydrolase [Nocardioides sp. R-C-SC26]|uniref:alpha/beta hydrolase n=1 Tax=Nocardioides sp. R-C-SC26 TaxID=2870414 RepID=UPI001E5C73BD|nr:alpha/beta hydrolase [Nocardioides sp. R-C-SC26]
MRRRSVLRLPFLAAGGTAVMTLSGCGEYGNVAPVPISDAGSGADLPDVRRVTYGEDASQFADLHLPDASIGDPRGVVVVIHGGFWSSRYDLSLGTPLAVSLAEQGWAAWNLEYRRVGGGGGAPATFDDVAAGIDALAEAGLPPSTLETVVTLGHSAGGHLAVWAAGRGRYGWADRVRLTHAISQAGVLDLVAGARLGGGAVSALLGHAPSSADERYDPAQQVPLDIPVWCVHARDDVLVPLEQSVDYVARATAAGAQAELIEVEGDHFVVIDPGSRAWRQTLDLLDTIDGG